MTTSTDARLLTDPSRQTSPQVRHAVTSHLSGTLSDLDKQVIGHVPAGGNWRDLPEDFPSARVRQIRAGAARGDGSRSTYYGRLSWGRPSYTISTYLTRPGNGAFIHPSLDRLITVREAARLQSFPDAVQFHGTLRQQCVQVGNAVPPLLAYHLGRRIPAGTVLDLFAGAGGLGLGLSWAGHELLASVDNNRDALATLGGHAHNRHDILGRDLSDSEQLHEVVSHVQARLAGRRLGLLAGGPPCQGFSTAGPCRVDDPRNRLVLSYLNAVEALLPENVLFENVLALRWRGKPFLDEVMGRLRALGYAVEAKILHAEAYGVPQLRRRLIIQASVRPDGVVWPDRTHEMLRPHFADDQPGAEGARSVVTVRDAIGDLAVPAAPTLETPVFLAERSNSVFGEWVRGEVPITALIDD